MHKGIEKEIAHWRGLLSAALKVKGIEKERVDLIKEALSKLDAAEDAVSSGSADMTFWATWDFVDALRDTIFKKKILIGEALQKPRPRYWPDEVQDVLKDAQELKKRNPKLSRTRMAEELARPGFGEQVLRKKWLPKWEDEGLI